MAKYRVRISRGLLLLAFFFSFVPSVKAQPGGVWGTRPLLSYFALTASLETLLYQGARLSPQEFSLVQGIAGQEAESLRALIESTRSIVSNPALSLVEKRRWIAAIGYNRRLEDIVRLTDLRLRQLLPSSSYSRLVAWIEQRWPVEQALHGQLSAVEAARGPQAARTYEIFATRYESKGGAYTVALPDQCLKFANGGLHTCDSKGYQPGAGYSLAISYKKGIGVLVGEAGPWNIDDNFWSTLSDPQPRRMFADLALGMPEAQAAYFNGYNGGLDQYGRKVSAPFAIDLAFKVGDDIGLPPKKNDWITVTFLWTADWGGNQQNPSGQTQGTMSAPNPTSNVIATVKTVTPAADGSITHIVQAGETLWTIAVAYRLPITQIQYLNNMGQTIVIYEGQKLMIKEAGPTWTPSAGATLAGASPQPLTSYQPPKTPSRTATFAPSPVMAKSTSTPTLPSLKEAARTATAPAVSNLSSETPPFRLSETSLLIGGLILAGAGMLLFGLGWWFGRRKDAESVSTGSDDQQP